jgi:chromate reductase
MRDGMFDPDGNIGAGSRAYLQNWMDKYAAWIRKNAA